MSEHLGLFLDESRERLLSLNASLLELERDPADPEHLAARLPVARDWRPRRPGHTIAVVGQSGVGKTSAVAQIAGRYRAAGLAVVVVAAGAGPHDALEAHLRRLDVQMLRAPDGEALATLRAQLGDRDLVLVDTAGCSHQDLAGVEALVRLLGPARPDETHLVVPAATPAADIGDLQRGFRIAGANRVTPTKLDETRHLGSLVNLPMRTGKPLAFLADGPSVPDAIAPADARRVAELLLP